MDLLNQSFSEIHDEVIRMHNHWCLYILTGSFGPASGCQSSSYTPGGVCTYMRVCISGDSNYVAKYVFTHTYVVMCIYVDEHLYISA